MSEYSRKRQSRFKRSQSPKGLLLQKRDKEIITAIFQFRYLTRSQIQRLFKMKCISRINIRLRKLFDHKFLDRYFRPTVTGSSQAVYFLGKKGISVVADVLALEDEEIKRRRRLDLAAKNMSLEHNLNVNDFRINLIKSISNSHHCELLFWRDARDCEYSFNYHRDGKDIKTSLRPDGYFELRFQKVKYAFFVEIDLSTSNHAKLKSKFNNYVTFADKSLYKKEFKRDLFYVLVATKTEKRADNLNRLASRLKPEMFWFTTLGDTENEFLFKTIWRRSGHKTIRPLFSRSKVRAIT